MITGTFFRCASIRVPRILSQFTGLRNMAAGLLLEQVGDVVLLFQPVELGVERHEPVAAGLDDLLQAVIESTKNGLFIVWKDTPKKLAFRPCRPAPGRNEGSPRAARQRNRGERTRKRLIVKDVVSFMTGPFRNCLAKWRNGPQPACRAGG